MAVLTIDVGGTPISLNCTRGGHAAPRRVGPKTVGNSGTEESSVRAELMVVPIITDPIPLDTALAVRALFAIGNQVPCEGDIFNKPGTIVCSGTITDQLRETADSVVLNLTLFEVEPTTASRLTYVYLMNDPSGEDPGDGSIAFGYVGTPPGSGFPDLGNLRVLDDATLITCGSFPDPLVTCDTVFSLAPERSWLTLPLAAIQIVGLMTATFLSKGGTGDKFAHQGVMAKIFLVRGGVDVEEADTDWAASNGGFAGSVISMSTTAAVVWDVEDGDKIRVEVWGRIALHGGYADGNDGSNLDRQTLTYGQGGTGVGSTLSVGGSLRLL